MAAAPDGELRFVLPLLRLRAASPLRSIPHDAPPSPVRTLATVPFKWEEKPGVPRPSCVKATMQQPTLKCLELPPCRVFPMTPSPTSVLDGHRKFSSFRMLRYSLESGGSISRRGSPDFDIFLGGGRRKNKCTGYGGGSFRFSSPSNVTWECSDETTEDDKLVMKNNKVTFCIIPQQATRPRHLLVSFISITGRASQELKKIIIKSRLPV